MTSARCPSCDAAVAADAQWCTLCYADLRQPVSEERPYRPKHQLVPAGGAEPLPPHPILDAPIETLLQAAEAQAFGQHAAAVAADATIDPPVSRAADVVTGPRGWPCQVCGELVGMELTTCPSCGGAFMGGVAGSIPVQLPVVGDITSLSTGARIAFMAGGACVLTMAIFVVFVILGHLV